MAQDLEESFRSRVWVCWAGGNVDVACVVGFLGWDCLLIRCKVQRVRRSFRFLLNVKTDIVELCAIYIFTRSCTIDLAENGLRLVECLLPWRYPTPLFPSDTLKDHISIAWIFTSDAGWFLIVYSKLWMLRQRAHPGSLKIKFRASRMVVCVATSGNMEVFMQPRLVRNGTSGTEDRHGAEDLMDLIDDIPLRVPRHFPTNSFFSS